MNEPINIISCGAGVQSSYLCIRAARGDFKDCDGKIIKVSHAVFADTQSEPKSVMLWLDWLEKEVLRLPFPFPIHRVTSGNLAENELSIRRSLKSGKLYLKSSIPAFVSAPDGSKGMLGRKCTTDFKIVPLQRKIRELVGIKRAGKGIVRANVWIGISIDEAHRMKPSRVDYIENKWPLIDYGISRNDCLTWMKDNNYPEPPRSACVFCPFHSNIEWLRIKTNEPEEFSRAVMFEHALQGAAKSILIGKPFLHSSCVDISKVDFENNLSGKNSQLLLFGNECEGMCGI